MVKISKKQAIDGAKTCLLWATVIAGLMICSREGINVTLSGNGELKEPNKEKSYYKPKYNCCYGATYGDAVAAISNSDMIPYYKNYAISGVKRDESGDYYEAVIAIAESDDWDSYYKAISIKRLG